MHGLAKSTILPLTLDAVRFESGGRLLIDGITLTFAAGSRSVILGPNGAGKSLLLRLCHGLLQPTGGAVRWALNGSAVILRRNQAMVFQRPVLLRRSALANVRYAVHAARIPDGSRRAALARAALERFGLGVLADRPARVLSSGEQQRLALARAWALEPEVLFLDEPTYSLDPAGTRDVELAIGAVHSAGTKIIMTTHDLGQARRLADEVVFLHHGKLIENTPADQFFRKPRTNEASAFVRGELLS